MSMKKSGQSLALLSIMTSMYGMPQSPQLTPESIEKLKKLRIQKGFEFQNTNKGLKEFNINGKTVWALNEKNAIRKANKF